MTYVAKTVITVIQWNIFMFHYCAGWLAPPVIIISDWVILAAFVRDSAYQ